MKKSIVALGMVLALSGCAAAADETLAAEPAALVEISPATEETAQLVEAAATAEPAQTATPEPTPEPTQAPTPAPTAEPTAVPTAEPTQAPVEETVTATPAQVSMSYGAVPFDLAAGTEQWWSIDSSDSAYWAVQENINAIRAAAGLSPLAMDGGLSAAADARCESFVAVKSAQPVLSARPAAYAAIGRTVLPTMPTSPTPALRAWVWPVGFAPPPRGSIPTGLLPSTKTPTCFHTQIMI